MHKKPDRVLKNMNVSNPSSRKSTPKQVKNQFESILNIRKRQHSEYEDNVLKLPDIVESVKALRQKCFNIEIENENLIKVINDLVDVTDDLTHRITVLESVNQENSNIKLKMMTLEDRLTKLENERDEQKESQCIEMKSADSAQTNNQGFQWVDLVRGKKKTTMNANNDVERVQAQQIPDVQTKIMANLVADSKDSDRRSKNLIIFGFEESKKTDLEAQRKDDENLVCYLIKELQLNIKIINISRFKSKPGQSFSPPVLIRLENEKGKDRVLSTAKKLQKSSRFPNVYINKDLSIYERHS